MSRRRPFSASASVLLALALACSGGQGESESDTSSVLEWSDPDSFPGLSDEVEIVVDKGGIPHIYASNDYDLFYAAGYQVARDRLFQMDLMRRRAYGRGAEVLGVDKLADDQLSRTLDFPRWGRLDADRLREESPDDYKLFVSWVAGVNARIAEVNAGEAPLPYGFGPGELDYAPEPWINEDPFVIAKIFTFANSNSLENELLVTVVERLLPQTLESVELPKPAFPVYTVPPEDRPAPSVAPSRPGAVKSASAPAPASIDAEALTRARSGLRRLHDALSSLQVLGSNNWAVDGRFTASGRPIVSNDPHQPLLSPSVMYALHLNSADRGGAFDVAGFGFAGAPGVQIGHTAKVHWAATTNFADVMDLWSITLSPDGATANVAGTQKPVTTRVETIKVKGEADRAVEIREVEGYGLLLDSLLGSLGLDEVLLVDPGRKVLFNWTGFRATNEARAFLKMARAQSVADFEDAVDTMEVGTFNFVSADAAGISYRVHALIPDRGDPSARKMPFAVIDGDDVGSYWTDTWLPREKMPASHATQTGFVVTANNDPWGFTGDGDVGNDPWYYGTFYASGFRAKRIEDRLKVLTAAGGITPEAMTELQLDTFSLLADQLVPKLEDTYGRVASDDALAKWRDRPDLDALVALLTQGWDRRMTRDAAAPLAFHVWLHLLTEEALADDLGLTYEPILSAAASYLVKFTMLAFTDGYPNGDGVLQEGRDRLILTALDETAAWLTANFGAVDSGYTWGERHGTEFLNGYGHDLDGGFVPVGGGEDTVNVSTSKFHTPEGEIAPRFNSHDGPVFRVVTEFAEDGTPVARLNFPRGNSGEPSSPHWDDAVDDWANGVYQPFAFRRDEVDAAKESALTLTPTGE
ncbi:MAG: penicillin acylase family protein [Nannocystaceae bacterium]